MSSAFTPEQWAYLEAHKNDSRVNEIRWCYSVPIPVSILSTAFRLWAKKAGRNGIRLDDYLIIFATICLVGECASGLGYGPPHGMGRHITAVSAEDLKIFRKGDYVFSHFYDVALGSVKLAILAFYYRVFIVPIFQRIVLATAAFIVCWEIAITVALALVCRPINTFWDDSVKGTCLNLVTFTYFTNISNLATDIWIFLLPIPVILRLQLPLTRKIGLCAIFSVGLATCVVSAIRITVVLGHGSPDFTWATVPLGAYSVFEPLGGILCTNLPIIWHMYRKIRSPLKNTSYSKQTQSTRPSRPSRQHSSVDESPNRWLPLPASSSQVELTKDGKGLQLDPTVVKPKPAEFWNSAERKGEDEEVGIAVPMNSIVVEREFRTEVTQNPESNGGVPGLRKNVYEVRKR